MFKKVDKCQNDTFHTDYSQCDKCEGNYRCLNQDKTKCNLISNLELYYYIDDQPADNDCMELCTKTYDQKRINCTNKKCTLCMELIYSSLNLSIHHLSHFTGQHHYQVSEYLSQK